ncbi:hypothetical protein BBO99_00005219 [Phytophthora kernoviae]|uniref:Condensation domain-containing protein n=2 Tax=Phytophthora kernoviae TaxID=325452 RepID=A0A421ESB6_9STRA|nr:hypothetical protein G195_006911 [Phytophthora kernoviae 00238/432]KAG2524774.1 hypothetical protein JM18_005227 [Phytophthora kernoviae]KAG2524950.1 hypothetical protein JM16_004594 [Phytophthora kernoviae]RLM96053.1 hypothetical protein BBI17_001697 [Phytophthora kernoviae]RLN79515.1 hypothetical protein BBO99_00005219 [Phytophthora kernoviae]
MVCVADKVNDIGDVLIPLSPMDAVMNTYRVVVLYIYPCPSTSGAEFDLEKLQRSFTTLVNEDYPVLIGKLHIDRESGTTNVRQTPEAREQGGAGIRFETNPSNPQTADDAMATLSWEFMPKARMDGEIIAVKCSLLADGGLVIGVDCSHVLFDGEAMFTFMRTWGQRYSGVGIEKRLVINHDRYLLSGKKEICRRPHPEFQTTPVRPLIRQPDGSLALKAASKPPKTAQHVFHLTPSNMAKLKKMASGVPEATISHNRHTSIIANLLSVFKSKRKKVANIQAPSCPSYVSTLDAITALFAILISRARGHNQSCMDGFVLITETPKAEEGLDVLVCLECATMDRFKALCANVPFLQE